MARVIVIGNATWDETFRLPRMPKLGETFLADGWWTDAGGKGLNQAIAAARAGAEVTLFAAVGDDEAGRLLEDALRREGVACDLVRRRQASDRSIIHVFPDGANMIVSGHDVCSSVRPEEIQPTLARLARGDVALLQGNLPLPTTLAALRAARAAGARTVMNASPLKYPYRDLYALIDVLVVNEIETEGLAGTQDIDAALRWFRAHGVGAAIVSLGGEGARALDAAGAIAVPASRVEAIDTAGAGDALCGALAAGLAQGLALAPALGWAVRAASLSVTRRGTSGSFPSRVEMQALREHPHPATRIDAAGGGQ
jgi:ribokinase